MHLSKDTFQQFRSFLTEQSGLTIPSDQSRSFEEKLATRVEKCRSESYENYLHLMKFHPEGRLELRALLDLVTISETYFFRNEPQFEVFRDYVIPKWVEKKTGKSGLRTLKIWSAGCSTGEEPYTLAMILKESLPCFDQQDLSIVATDINRQALKAAGVGVYGSRSVQHVPEHLMGRFFSGKGQKYWLEGEIKQMVRFESHNLATDPYTLPGLLDVDCIFCRNVTIYFDPKTLKRVIAQFTDCLAPDGYLFIGHAETLWGISNDFEAIEFPQTFLYQKRAEPSPKASRFHIPLPSVVSQTPDRSRRTRLADAPAWRAHDAQANDALLQQATDLANRGDYQKALDQLRGLVKEDNLWTSAHYLMGVLLTKLEKYEEAIGAFRHVLYIDEKLAIGYYHLGNLYRFLGQDAQAKKEYTHCLKLLKMTDDSKPVPLSEGLTVGVMTYATERALSTG